jgi:HAD superfamily hydrolase (TIGR01509 family)
MEAIFEAIIFDLDGVLWDTASLHELAFRKSLAESGYYCDNFNYQEIAGMRTDEAFKKLLAGSQYIDDEEYLKLTEKKREVAHCLIKDVVPVFPDTLELIKGVQKLGLKTGIATSTSRKNLHVFLGYLTNHSISVDAALSGDDVTNSKPSPVIYEQCARGLETARERCLVIEDSERGIEAAIAARCWVLQVSESLQPMKKSSFLIGVRPSRSGVLEFIKTYLAQE